MTRFAFLPQNAAATGEATVMFYIKRFIEH